MFTTLTGNGPICRLSEPRFVVTVTFTPINRVSKSTVFGTYSEIWGSKLNTADVTAGPNAGFVAKNRAGSGWLFASWIIHCTLQLIVSTRPGAVTFPITFSLSSHSVVVIH